MMNFDPEIIHVVAHKIISAQEVIQFKLVV